MAESTENRKKEKGNVGTILSGILILALIVGFILFRAGVFDEKTDQTGGTSESEAAGLNTADAVQVEVGEDFAQLVDPEGDTFIKIHTAEAGRYYVKAKAANMGGGSLTIHTYKMKPKNNDLMGGLNTSGDGSGNYEMQLTNSPYIEGDMDYYIVFDWQKDCGVESIAIEFEPLEMAELDENLVKELGAVQLVEGETYEGPFKVGEENWFYIILDREGSPVFDLTFSKEQTPGVVAMEHMELYVQQEDGTLIPVRDNDITTGLEGNMIHRRAPSYSPLSTANPYFLSIYMEEDQGLKKLDMKISGKPRA